MIEFIEIFKWPAVVFIMFLILKKSIVTFFRKSKSLSLEGGGIKFESEQEQGFQPVKSASILENATKLFRPETINLFRGYVQNETNYDKLTTDKEKFETLLTYSTTIYILKEFGIIYDTIFGSQIALLQLLNSKGPQGPEVFNYYFEQAKERYPEAYENMDLEKYPKFLYSYLLISNNQDQKVYISILGRDFLKFLTDTGKDIYKDF